MSKTTKGGKSKSANKRKKKKSIRVLPMLSGVFLLSMALVGLIALHNLRDSQHYAPEDRVPANFWFKTTGGGWDYEVRQILSGSPTYIVEQVLQGLVDGPQSAAFEPSVPEQVRITRAQISSGATGNFVEVFLDGGFSDLPPVQRITLTNSLIWTLTDLAFIDYVVFLVSDSPMAHADGTPFGARNQENTLLGDAPIEPVLPEAMRVVLYFSDDMLMYLWSEEREIEVNRQLGIEMAIMQALIDGPQTAGLYGTVPDFGLNRVVRDGDIVIVDFATDLLGMGSTGEMMFVYSVVNTLTELSGVRRVRFLANGLVMDGHMDFSTPIERNEGIIAP